MVPIPEYNVTYRKLTAYLEASGTDYRRSQPSELDNEMYGLGAVYSKPDGLKQNVLEHVPYVKGFAVVAEIKSLSNQSKHSAQEISNNNDNVMPLLNPVNNVRENYDITESASRILNSVRHL